MLEYKSHNSGRMGILVFRGRLDGNCYRSLESLLMMALISEDSVMLDFTDVTSVDLECFKLFCTSHRTASVLNKKLLVQGVRSEIFTSALKDPRYSRHVHCVLKDSGDCYFEKAPHGKSLSVPGGCEAVLSETNVRLDTRVTPEN